jgi:hypothetical protein
VRRNALVRIGRDFRVRVGAVQQFADVVPGRAELVPRGERVTDRRSTTSTLNGCPNTVENS